MNEQTKTENTEKSGEVEEFVTDALRGPRQGVYGQLLAQLLVKANIISNPLLKNQAICEAAFYSKKKEKLDMDLIDICLPVSTSLINTEKNNISAQSNRDMIRCSWSFKQTEENFKKLIKPWQILDLEYYSIYTRYVNDEHPHFSPVCTYSYADDVEQWHKYKDEILEEVDAWFKKLSDSKVFYEETYALSRLSFAELVGEFEDWATVKLRPIQAILSEEVNPEIYRDILQMMTQKVNSENTQELKERNE